MLEKGCILSMKEKEKLAITEELTKRVFLDDKKLTVPDPDW